MRDTPSWFDSWPARTVAVLILFGLLALTIYVTGRDDTTNRESALWTFILWMFSLALSFYFGRVSVKNAAAEIVRPQARGAARRLVTLGQGIVGFSEMVELNRQAAGDLADKNSGVVPLTQVEHSFGVMDLYMRGQLQAVAAALEDWREFEPKIVNEILNEMRSEAATDGRA
jgi:hypothetical protein